MELLNKCKSPKGSLAIWMKYRVAQDVLVLSTTWQRMSSNKSYGLLILDGPLALTSGYAPFERIQTKDTLEVH